MKTHFSIVVCMLVVSLSLRMLIFIQHWQFTKWEYIYFFGNPFVMMTGVFMGIRLFKQLSVSKTSFIADLKSGIKVAGMYSVLMALFAYLYYSYIDSEYLITKLNSQIQTAIENGATESNVIKHQENGEFFLSAYFMSTVTLVGFIILGTFYSSLITFFVRKIRNEV
ncbi:DUF4199 domain-containing protein [Vicingaceae bacterium]|nr:DUF4199 domain-containing protein [Vicingaceae bacterium]